MSIYPITLTSHPGRQSSAPTCHISPPGMAPALLTRMSMSPAAACSLSISPFFVKSAGKYSALTPCASVTRLAMDLRRSSCRAAKNKSAPSSANTSARPSPIPCDAPVINTLLPLSPRSICLTSCFYRSGYSLSVSATFTAPGFSNVSGSTILTSALKAREFRR